MNTRRILLSMVALGVLGNSIHAQSLWMSSGGATGETARFELLGPANSLFVAFWTVAPVCPEPPGLIVPVTHGRLNSQGQTSFVLAVPDEPVITGQRIAVNAGFLSWQQRFLWPIAGKATAVSIPVNGTLPPGATDPTITALPDHRFVLTGGVSSSSISIYDPHNNKLIPAGAMTTSRHPHKAAVLSNGTVFIAGGSVSYPEVYDPKTNTSRKLPGALPLPSGCVAVRDPASNKEWAVTYYGGTVWAYDIATGVVTTTSTPSTSGGQAAVVIAGKPEVVFLGGSTRGFPSTTGVVEAYNLRTGKWRLLGYLQWGSSGLQAIAIGPYVLTTGGTFRYGETDQVQLFDTTAGMAMVVGKLIVARSGYHAMGLTPAGVLRVGGGACYQSGECSRLVEEVSITGTTPLRPIPAKSKYTQFAFDRIGRGLCVAGTQLFYLP